MTKLEKLYSIIRNSQDVGVKLGDDVLRQVNELEEQIIKEEILPSLEKNIEPTLKQIQRDLVLVVEYKPGEPISVALSRKTNISQLIEAKKLEQDSQAEHQEYGKHEQPRVQVNEKTLLRVTMPDGQVIQTPKAKQTFVEVIRRIGFMRVRALGISFCHVPLVSTTLDSKYEKAQVPVEGGLYIMTHSSTGDKRNQLEKIAQSLNLNIKVEIIDAKNDVVQTEQANTSSASSSRKMYSFNGSEPLNKRRFVLAVVKHFAKNHPHYTFVQMANIFFKELQGSYGVIRPLAYIQKRAAEGHDDMNRFFIEKEDILTSADGIKYVVCHQWGNQFPSFVKAIQELGYVVIEN